MTTTHAPKTTSFNRPGEASLRRLLLELRATAAPRTNAAIRSATNLIAGTGVGQMAAGDIAAVLGAAGTTSRHSIPTAVESFHRTATRNAAKQVLPTLGDVTDDDVVDALFDVWDRAASEFVCRTIRTTLTHLAEEADAQASTADATSQRRALERAQMRRVDEMATALATHAYAAGIPASGYVPETIIESAKQFLSDGSDGLPAVEPSRFGYGEVSALDPVRAPASAYWHPTMRARRILSAVVRLPELDIFYAVDADAQSAIDRIPQALAETRDLTESDLARKILTDVDGDARPPSALDLMRIAGGIGFTGWARRIAKTVAGSKRRDVRQRRQRAMSAQLELPADREVVARNDIAASNAADAEASNSWLAETETLDAALSGETDADHATEAADVIRKAASPLEKTLIGAYELHHAFQIPPLVAPEDAAEREQLRAMLTEDAGLAERSLKAHHDELLGATTKNQRWIPAEALDLWLEFDANAADELLGRSPGVIRAVAAGAVVPSPVLRGPVQESFELLLLDACGAPDWAAAATALADGWRALTAKAVPSKVSTRKFTEGLRAARQVPGNPVPADNDDVMAWCRHLAVSALVQVRASRVMRTAELARANAAEELGR